MIIINNIKQFIEGMRIDFYCYQIENEIFRGRKSVPLLIYAVVYIFLFVYYIAIARTLCGLFGHSIVDESYGNEESGAVDMYCKRCGEHWHEQIY